MHLCARSVSEGSEWHTGLHVLCFLLLSWPVSEANFMRAETVENNIALFIHFSPLGFLFLGCKIIPAKNIHYCISTCEFSLWTTLIFECLIKTLLKCWLLWSSRLLFLLCQKVNPVHYTSYMYLWASSVNTMLSGNCCMIYSYTFLALESKVKNLRALAGIQLLATSASCSLEKMTNSDM